MEKRTQTLLLDEADTYMRENEQLSSLAQSLSASWAQLSRIAGDSFTCPAFCAYRSTHQR